MNIDVRVEDLLYNYKYVLGQVLKIKDMMRGEYETESGLSNNPEYPAEYLKLIEECKAKESTLKEIAEIIKKETQVSSFELAQDYSAFLSQGQSEKYKVCNKKVGDLSYLYVSQKNNPDSIDPENVIDVDVMITKDSKRGLFDKVKIVNGEEHHIKSFLPAEYMSIFDPVEKQGENGVYPTHE